METTIKRGRKAANPIPESEATQPVAKAIPTTPIDENALKQVFTVVESTAEEEILRVSALPGTLLEFDSVRFKKLSDSFIAMLPASGQKAYWKAEGEFESRRKLADRALFETPTVVDPMAKLLDGPRGMANPLERDKKYIEDLLPEYYVTWRIEGGQGDLPSAKEAGFREMRHPKDDTERKEKSPLEWTGDRWSIRDGTQDPQSGDQIYNVMVVIRKRLWNDNLSAMSLVSHNKYLQHKQQFVEGVDNITRDTRESIEISDLDELHVEEHTMVQEGKRVTVDPRK
jgi:hypothetical protein